MRTPAGTHPPLLPSHPTQSARLPYHKTAESESLKHRINKKSEGEKTTEPQGTEPPPYRDCRADWRRLEDAKKRLHESVSISPFHEWDREEALETRREGDGVWVLLGGSEKRAKAVTRLFKGKETEE